MAVRGYCASPEPNSKVATAKQTSLDEEAGENARERHNDAENDEAYTHDDTFDDNPAHPVKIDTTDNKQDTSNISPAKSQIETVQSVTPLAVVSSEWKADETNDLVENQEDDNASAAAVLCGGTDADTSLEAKVAAVILGTTRDVKESVSAALSSARNVSVDDLKESVNNIVDTLEKSLSTSKDFKENAATSPKEKEECPTKASNAKDETQPQEEHPISKRMAVLKSHGEGIEVTNPSSEGVKMQVSPSLYSM